MLSRRGGTAAARAQTVDGPQPVGQWAFRNNLFDSSGNGHHAIFIPTGAGLMTFTDGPLSGSRAVSLGDDNNSISYGRTGLEPDNPGFTLMGWIKLSTTGAAGELGLLTHARIATSSRSRLGINRDTRNPHYVARWKGDLHTNESVTPTAGALDSGWHHLALVDGNTKWSLYVDGVLQSGHTGTRALDTGTTMTWEDFPWRSGYDVDLGDQFADPNMTISGVRIFADELTGAQISAWMNTAIPAAAPNTTSPTLSLLTDVTPKTAVDVELGPLNLGMRFKSSIDTTVTGVKFFKGSTSNGGTHIGALWTNAGTKLAEVTFTGETSSGWQSMLFSSAVSITADTTYVVSYLCPQGRYGHTGGFFGSDYVNGSLTGPASTGPAPNGTFNLDGTLTFPTSTPSTAAGCFFVDVIVPNPDYTP